MTTTAERGAVKKAREKAGGGGEREIRQDGKKAGRNKKFN